MLEVLKPTAIDLSGHRLPHCDPAAGARGAVGSNALPPHIYLVAATAFRQMLREKTPQSLIVNGGLCGAAGSGWLVTAPCFARCPRTHVRAFHLQQAQPHLYCCPCTAGESGAGKTETTKKAMQYFATLAGGTGVEDQVLEVRAFTWGLK